VHSKLTACLEAQSQHRGLGVGGAARQPSPPPRPHSPLGMCELPAEVKGRLLQLLPSARDLCAFRAVCRKARAAADQWEPELWRPLVVEQFVPEAWMARLEAAATSASDGRAPGVAELSAAAAAGAAPWVSWKQVYVRLHLKARQGPALQHGARLLRHVMELEICRSRADCRVGAGGRSPPRSRQTVPRAVDVVAKLQRLAQTKSKVHVVIREQEQHLATLHGQRSVAEAELARYTGRTIHGQRDLIGVERYAEAMQVRQHQASRRCAEVAAKLRQYQLLQVSVAQGLQALLRRVTTARAIRVYGQAHASLGMRALNEPVDVIGMIALQLQAIQIATAPASAAAIAAAAAAAHHPHHRPGSPDSDSSSLEDLTEAGAEAAQSSGTCVGTDPPQLAVEQARRGEGPPAVALAVAWPAEGERRQDGAMDASMPASSVAVDTMSAAEREHIIELPIFGRMRPLQWAVEIGAEGLTSSLITSGAHADFGDALWAWRRGGESGISIVEAVHFD
jgi:hypothetical protein